LENNMTKIIGIILLVLGALGLAYGGFTYTKDTHKASIGPLSLSVVEKESVNIPLWASIIALAAGAGVLVMGSRKG
jgi:hypothetical protein